MSTSRERLLRMTNKRLLVHPISVPTAFPLMINHRAKRQRDPRELHSKTRGFASPPDRLRALRGRVRLQFLIRPTNQALPAQGSPPCLMQDGFAVTGNSWLDGER
jgi:hypothetical protein